ncbi:MAG: kelch repeat-containing protein [Phycisphaerae bacterium]|nr:kelch repeat-containing protein [Phycisphaerae bacterium]
MHHNFVSKAMIPLLSCVLAGSALAAEPPAANPWAKAVDGNKNGNRQGAALVWRPDIKQAILLGGLLEGPGAPAQTFDPATATWSDLPSENLAASKALAGWGGYAPGCQAVYDPTSKLIFCMHNNALHSFDPVAKAWKKLAPEGTGSLVYHALAIDVAGRQLVVVAADKDPKNLGWSATAVYDIAADKWSRLEAGSDAVRKAHEDRKAALEAIRELVGRTRFSWFRDPAGAGTDAERKGLADRAVALGKLPGMEPFKGDLDAYAGQLGEKKGLDALKTARALQRRFEEAMEAAAPTPPARRNARIACDVANKVVVLFGGDHEDYTMNDTWILDLAKKEWRRGNPKVAPPHRGGGMMTYLPKSGKVALYDGYVQNNSLDYAARPWNHVAPHDLWVYDTKADSWTLLATWPTNPTSSAFFGYSSERYSFPAAAADGDDNLIFADGAATWKLAVDPAKPDAAAAAVAEKLARPANTRAYRTGPFLAEFCEVADAPKDPEFDKLPANKWVRLPGPPRNSAANGVRAKTWCSATWDADNEQIIYWGAGHCLRSPSTPMHWSPAANRMVDAYDVDEPYSWSGGGACGSTLLGRPWLLSPHAYRLNCYDPKSKMMVYGYGGFLYDPARMEWVRGVSFAPPFAMEWGNIVMQGTPHGAVAWAGRPNRGPGSLWLFDQKDGWTDLKPAGDVGVPWCDSNGMTYDSKRDRLVLGPAGGKSGQMTIFDFATKKAEKVTPANDEELGRVGNSREMVYVAHADWIVFMDSVASGEKSFTRIYDCEKNRYLALDAGKTPHAEDKELHSLAASYDAKRKIVYVIQASGGVRAIRLDPATAAVREKP